MTSSTGRMIAAAAVKYNILGLISAGPELSRPESATTRKQRLLYSPCFIRRPHERTLLLTYLGLTDHRRIHGLPEFQQSNTELGPLSTTTSPFWTPGLDLFLPPLGSLLAVFISSLGLLLGHFEGDPNSSGMNDETLALREQITEIETYHIAQRGQNAHASNLDHDVAILAFEDELRMRLMNLNQRSLARDIPHAAHNNDELNSTETERNTHTGWGTGFSSIVRTIRSLSPSIAQTKPEADTQCCVCFDYYRRSKIIRLKCSHLYCTGCLKSLFVRTTNDLSLFPPKCCRQGIPLYLIKSELSADERRKFKRAEVEFTTESKTYCSNSNCRTFIPPSSIVSDRATCRACRSVTCTMCQNPAHGGDCPSDRALQATLSLAGSQGWRRCNWCRSMVELWTGCNHITCRCGAQFCYICGLKWKTCRCSM